MRVAHPSQHLARCTLLALTPSRSSSSSLKCYVVHNCNNNNIPPSPPPARWLLVHQPHPRVAFRRHRLRNRARGSKTVQCGNRLKRRSPPIFLDRNVTFRHTIATKRCVAYYSQVPQSFNVYLVTYHFLVLFTFLLHFFRSPQLFLKVRIRRTLNGSPQASNDDKVHHPFRRHQLFCRPSISKTPHLCQHLLATIPQEKDSALLHILTAALIVGRHSPTFTSTSNSLHLTNIAPPSIPIWQPLRASPVNLQTVLNPPSQLSLSTGPRKRTTPNRAERISLFPPPYAGLTPTHPQTNR